MSQRRETAVLIVGLTLLVAMAAGVGFYIQGPPPSVPKAASLLSTLQDPTKPSINRHQAAVALGQGDASVVPALVEVLRDGDVQGRRSAAMALGMLGRQAGEAVTALSAALGDPDADVREFAARRETPAGALAYALRPGDH